MHTEPQPLPSYLPVSSIMSRRVVAVHEDDTVDSACTLLLDERISGVPVIDDQGRLCGTVTKTDMVRDAWLGDLAITPGHSMTEEERDRWGADVQDVAPAQVRVHEIMTPYALCVAPVAPVDTVARLMVQERVHRVFVVDDAGHPMGVVSLVDVARWSVGALE